MASSGKTGGGTTRDHSDGSPKKKTPKKWKSKKSTHHEKGSGKYPNYHQIKTRSGHAITYDDSKGQESIKIQHRGGSALEFMPDGAIQMTSHNGQYNIVFGEHRMTVTGAHDLTVKGAASMLVYGDYNKTVHGDVNMTVTGDYNVNCKKSNLVAREGQHIVADEQVTKIAKGMQTQVGGDAVITAYNNATFVGRDNVNVGGKQVHVRAGSGGMDVKSEGNYNETIKKDKVAEIQGSSSKKIQKDYNRQVSGDHNTNVSGDQNLQITGNRNEEAAKKYFNSQKSKAAQPGTQFSLKFNESGAKPFGSSMPSISNGIQ